MAPTDEMQRLQLSDGEPDSPPPPRRTRSKSSTSNTERAHGTGTAGGYHQEEAREAALRKELQTVQNVNQAIEGVIESLERAKGNMEVCTISPGNIMTIQEC